MPNCQVLLFVVVVVSSTYIFAFLFVYPFCIYIHCVSSLRSSLSSSCVYICLLYKYPLFFFVIFFLSVIICWYCLNVLRTFNAKLVCVGVLVVVSHPPHIIVVVVIKKKQKHVGKKNIFAKFRLQLFAYN